MSFQFPSVDRFFSVIVHGKSTHLQTASNVWLHCVGKHLLANGKSWEFVAESYAAAGLDPISSTWLRTKLQTMPRLPGRIHFDIDFIPNAVTTSVVVAPSESAIIPYNTRRTVARQYKKEVEDHFCQLFPVFGALFGSNAKFEAAYRMLRNQPRSVRDDMGNTRVKRLRSTVGGVSFPAFPHPHNYYDALIHWARQRIPMGSIICQHEVLLDNISVTVRQLLEPTSPCADSIVHLLLWVDGTGTGTRPYTVARIRMVDPSCLIFPSGASKLVSVMECFYPETGLPLTLTQALFEQLGKARSDVYWANGFKITLDCMIIVADNKQLQLLCGIQGQSTSQRCSHCKAHASLFVMAMFEGESRHWTDTARDAQECARCILEQTDTIPKLRLKFGNVRNVPAALFGECDWPLGDIDVTPPILHITRHILESVFVWLHDNILLQQQKKTLTKARDTLFRRLRRTLGLHSG